MDRSAVKNDHRDKNILFVNDFVKWNILYRVALMQALEKLGYNVENFGLRDNVVGFFSFLRKDLSETYIVARI